jgi:uncharacterized repeat protein (TIGR01451 family)
MASASRCWCRWLLPVFLLVQAGCMGGSSNPSYFPHIGFFEDIVRTHAKPSGPAYFSDFDKNACRIECYPLEATNPVHTQHVLIATVYDEKGQPRRDRRVEWMLEGVGQIVEVDESGLLPGRGYKVDNKYAVSYTSYFEHHISRRNGNPNDDFVIKPGQTWCVITSALEGDSHVIAYAPEIANWDKHKAFVVKHWVDAEWVWPKPAVNRFGTTHVFTTKVYRHSDGQPLTGYRVRYKILDGPPAMFLPSRAQTEEAITSSDGVANVTIAQVAPAAGVNRIGIEIIRPPESGNGVGMVIARSETRKEWVAPQVHLEKTAPESVAIGQEIPYVLTITNHGQVETKTVTVRDFKPKNVRYLRSDPPASEEGDQLIWTLGELRPGQPRTINVVFQSEVIGAVRNRATLTTDEGQTDEKQTVTQVMQPQIKLAMIGPETAVKNVPITYQLRVTNPGSGTATNVLIQDRFDKSLEHESKANPIELPVGTVGPGETKTYTLALTPRATGQLWNEAVVTADGGLKDTAKHTVAVQEAQLSLKQIGPARRVAGRPATYTITVTNPGESTVDNLVVREQLPVELTFKNADSNGQFDGGAVVWSLGSLKPQESKVVQVTATCSRLTPAAVLLATATAAPGLRAEDKATTQVLGLPGFRVELVDLTDPVPVGGKTTYKIDVTNQGSLAGDQVKIVARIPEQMKFLTATGPAKYTVEDSGRRVVFEPIDGVAPGKKLTYLVDVLAEKAGVAVFHMEMTASALSSPVEEQESTNIFQPGQRVAPTAATRTTAPPTPVGASPVAPRNGAPTPIPAANGGAVIPLSTPPTPPPKSDDFPPAPKPIRAGTLTPLPRSSGPPPVPPPDNDGPADVPPPGAPTTGADGKPRGGFPELPPPP